MASNDTDTPDAISKLEIEGFKSLAESTEIEIRPLTLLAGANSSGKSSAMQPLLLLKQTLEAQFDPGPLLLNGKNIKLTSAKQIFSVPPSSNPVDLSFSIGLTFSSGRHLTDCFAQNPDGEFVLRHMTFDNRNQWWRGGSTLQEGFQRSKPEEGAISADMDSEDIIDMIPPPVLNDWNNLIDDPNPEKWNIRRNRCFLYLDYSTPDDITITYNPIQDNVSIYIQSVLHVPGLRDNPSRTYKTTAIGNRFPGTMDDYVASVIHAWQREDDERLNRLVDQLRHMGLTDDVAAKRINDTQVELRVEQQPVGHENEGRMINVADVGIGVSQVLPVLVACLAAEPGQLVYIEQPEIHLHPRAQTRLADVFVEAANRGVRLVVETHSQLLLLALQARIAEEHIDPETVMLHWFSRRDDGVTEVDSRQPDEKGAFGDWPEDFSEVEMEAENRYLDAAEKHLFSK